jgi:hypothetical protein
MEVAELVRPPTPMETLTEMGFTPNEAKSFLNRIENSFSGQPSKLVRYSQQQSQLRHSWLKKLMTISWGYAFVIWLYVIAMQLRFPDSVYWPLAVWVPIRMDYLGEVAFGFSFILALAITIWNPKLRKLESRFQS